MKTFPWTRQLLRYGVVGLGSNAILFLCYLFLTARGMGPKWAMSLLYAIGVLQTFLLNRTWTFRHRGNAPASLIKYGACYTLGYVFNWAMLYALVDRAGWSHRPTQAGLVICTAVILFVLQKQWVFAGVKSARRVAQVEAPALSQLELDSQRPPQVPAPLMRE